MEGKILPNGPAFGLLEVIIGLDDEKDAMASCCLDRKEVRCTPWRLQSGTGQPVETQDGFFYHLAGRSALTELANMHWIGY